MPNVNNMTQCALLIAAGLQDLVLVADSDAYIERQASYWAANVPLRPTCIVQPRTTDEVSQVVEILADADGLLALRSGGHTQWAGSNDVHNGVTIDLGRMIDVTYDAHSGLASLQPGPKWADVYFQLLEHRVCVTGGREGNVGVVGFLTRGGNSYYAGLHGLGCDNVANFEVVLANGDIINANATSHSDLWTALKGGSGNFGIVTRFDISEGDRLAELTVDFTNTNHKNPETAFILNHSYNAASGSDVLVAHIVVDIDGTANPMAFDEILKVPVVLNDVSTRSMANMSASYNLPRHQQQVWFSLTFKNDARVIKKATELHDDLVNELKIVLPIGNFSTQCLFQPMPTLFAEHSVRRGGNILGLDQVKENTLLWLLVGSTQTVKESEVMRAKITALKNALEEFTRREDLNVDWQYLNYVDETQQPLESYGNENVAFLRAVAKKHDSTGIFQNKFMLFFPLA
ncbi:hypothetical protein E8E12_003421 [Didymella heteroderae]|uniref:FAD-binding PCMH-type domain-containing protein n=1 Tax=Didymella heteroderae TaxID=1769908 RepID=A0A9P4WKC4_9PLEO|nr:hypothetical protein E8E12_003421 [Didymella heteroderae]